MAIKKMAIFKLIISIIYFQSQVVSIVDHNTAETSIFFNLTNRNLHNIITVPSFYSMVFVLGTYMYDGDYTTMDLRRSSRRKASKIENVFIHDNNT